MENRLKTAQNMFKRRENKLQRNSTPSQTSKNCGSEMKLPLQLAKLKSSENFFLVGNK